MDERGQIAYSSGPFRGSEAYRDACQSALANPKITHRCNCEMHTHTRTSVFTLGLPRSLSLTLSFFLSLCFRRLCFATSARCFLSQALISLLLARFCMYSLCLLSPICTPYQSAFMLRIFLSSLVSCRRAFIFPRLFIIKSFIEKSFSKASHVSVLADRQEQEGPRAQCDVKRYAYIEWTGLSYLYYERYCGELCFVLQCGTNLKSE